MSLVAQQASVRTDTQIPVELGTTIKTQSAKVGDRIKFRTTEAVLIGNNIVVPQDATITGRIEKVLSDAEDSPHSVVRISIDHLQWKNGQAPLNAVVFGIEPTAAEEILRMPRRRSLRELPNFLKDIRIRAHLGRSADTEFYSNQSNFTLQSGLYFLLRQIDPDHDPAMMGKDHTINVGPQK